MSLLTPCADDEAVLSYSNALDTMHMKFYDVCI